MGVHLFRVSRLCYSSDPHWWSVYTHIVYSILHIPFQLPVYILRRGSHFSFTIYPAFSPSSLSLTLSLPCPLSLSKEETRGGQLTTCQAQSATGTEETAAAAAAKEEEEKGREMVISRRKFETIISNHFISNFCNEKFVKILLKSTPEWT